MLPDPAQLRDLTQVDHHLRPLRPLFQPVERVHPPGQHPGLRSVAGQQLHRVVHTGGLQQLERRHHIVNHRHRFISPACVLTLDMCDQTAVDPPARLERVQDHVCRDRRPP